MASCKSHRPPKEQETVEGSWLCTSLAQQILFKIVLICAQHKAGKVFFLFISLWAHSFIISSWDLVRKQRVLPSGRRCQSLRISYLFTFLPSSPFSCSCFLTMLFVIPTVFILNQPPYVFSSGSQGFGIIWSGVGAAAGA